MMHKTPLLFARNVLNALMLVGMASLSFQSQAQFLAAAPALAVPSFGAAEAPAQIDTIKSTAQAVLDEGAQVTLFGSRVYDYQKGGDVDLMVEVSQAISDPAVLAARLSSQESRSMHGCKVDVVLKAPNLMEQPIHRIAKLEGIQI